MGAAPATILPHLCIFVGGLATKVGHHLINRIQQEYGNLEGPFELIFFDTVREFDMVGRNGAEAGFVYLRPLALRRFLELMPKAPFAVNHCRHLQKFSEADSRGAGSTPPIGCTLSIAYMHRLTRALSERAGALVDPARAARTEEDERFRGRSLDSSKLFVDVVAGHGGTSALSIFPVAQALREHLQRQNLSVHIRAHLLLASAHCSLPSAVQPIVLKNMAIQIQFMDALESGAPGVKREIALVDGTVIRGNGPPPFDEIVLYGQRPGETLGPDEFANNVATSFFYQLLPKTGPFLASRQADVKSTIAPQLLQGRLRIYSSIAPTELSALPADFTERFPLHVQRTLLEREQAAWNDTSKAHELCERAAAAAKLLEDFTSSVATGRVVTPAVSSTTTAPALAALVNKFKSDVSRENARAQERFAEQVEWRKATFVSELERVAEDQPVTVQVEAYAEAVALCRESSQSQAEVGRKCQALALEADAELSRLVGSMERSDEWLEKLRVALGRAADPAAAGPDVWRKGLADVASQLQRKLHRLVELQKAITDMEIRLPSPCLSKSSLMSSNDLIVAAEEPLSAGLQSLRQSVVEASGDGRGASLLTDVLRQISESIADRMHEKYGTVAGALLFIAEQNSISKHLEDQIEETQPMLAVDRELTAEAPPHITTCVLLPEGTIQQLAAKGIDLGALHGATVMEDRVEDLVIVRAFRGYSAPVIPEIRKAVDALCQWYRTHHDDPPPWPHVLDAPPLPIPLAEKERTACVLLARVIAQGGTLRLERHDGITWLCNGETRVRLARDEEDILEGALRAIEADQIDPGAVNKKIDQYYEQNGQDERERLLFIAQHRLNKARGGDYVVAMKLMTAIDWFLRFRQSRGKSRTEAFCLTGE